MKFFRGLLFLIVFPGLAYSDGRVFPDLSCELNCSISKPSASSLFSPYPYINIGFGNNYFHPSSAVSNAETNSELKSSASLLSFGYAFSPYFSIEGRYSLPVSSSTFSGSTFSPNIFSAYIKPSYPVLDSLSIYALAGYTSVNFFSPSNFSKTDGLSTGLGAAYEIDTYLDVFVDYTTLFNSEQPSFSDPINFTFDSINLGITYKF